MISVEVFSDNKFWPKKLNKPNIFFNKLIKYFPNTPLVIKWGMRQREECFAQFVPSRIEKVEAELGPIDVVVANAGILRDAPFHKMTPEQWNEVIATNLTGVFNTVHPVWPGMRERKFGRVIVISSINGQKGQFGQVNYAATKAGDLGIVKSLAQEGARNGITANAICPGYVLTPLVEKQIPATMDEYGLDRDAVIRDVLLSRQPSKEFATMEQIGGTTVFLASDAAAQITGTTISVDGGWTAL